MLQAIPATNSHQSSHPCGQSWHPASIVDISRIVQPKNEEVIPLASSETIPSTELKAPCLSIAATSRPSQSSIVPSKRSAARVSDSTSESPAKKQSKWSPEEDAMIIQLRGEGMKWEDISKHLPGRSAISCRLHYQNYLERRSEWDEDRKNKLARLYERFKAEMWSKIADEMAIPWRAAEAMHWQIGEHEMARRAGVTPFALTNASMTQQNGALVSRLGRSHGPRSRTDSLSRSGGQQLPSLAELTAGLPAYASPVYHQYSDRFPSTPYDQILPLPRQSLTPPPGDAEKPEYFVRRRQ